MDYSFVLDRIKSKTHNFPEYDFAKELLLTVSSFTYCEHDKSESNVLLQVMMPFFLMHPLTITQLK